MKLISTIFLLLLEVNFLYAQDIHTDSLSNQVRGDIIYFEKLLPEYEVDHCLRLILNTVVESERRAGLLNASKFYALNFQWRFQGKDSVLYLLINADKWMLSHEMDYSGFMIIRGVHFLVRGGAVSNGVIRKCPDSGDTIRLQRPVSNDFIFFYKCLADFEGYYQGCNGAHLFLNLRLESNIRDQLRTRPIRGRKGKK